MTAVAKDVQASARKFAPGLKRWESMADDRVREQHVITDALHPAVPENVRYELPSYQWDRDHYGVGAITYMSHPKDYTSGLLEDAAAIHHCRCKSIVNPAGLSKKVLVRKATVTGTSVNALVSITGAYVIQAERGDIYPPPVRASAVEERGTRFMQKGALSVQAPL